jgi:zinc protease
MAALALAFASTVQAAPAAVSAKAANEIPIPNIPYTKFVLKNGLTVLVHEDHKSPVVAVNTWYHVGSKNEKAGKTGFAHLFEHLMFSGSEHFNSTYINAMERIGATDLNGTTNTDRTNYFENVPTSMVDYALFAESDRMGHLLGVLDQKKLDLQRGVVQNEKRMGENQPYGITRELLPANTYPVGHPYSWSVIGSMADLDAASMKDVQEWFKTNYGPNNVVLVLAGDITPEVARQKVEKYFGDIPAGPPLAHQEAWIAKRTGTHRGVAQDRVPQTRIYRVWNVPGAYTPDEALLDLGAHERRHERNRRPVRHDADRPPRRRHPQDGAGRRRGTARAAQERPDRGRAAAGQDRHAGPLHPHRRARWRLRRQERPAGQLHHLYRQSRLLQGLP